LRLRRAPPSPAARHPARAGDLDNTPVIEQVLSLRQEKARLLGFSSFAELSMASKMATLGKAEGLLEELRAASYEAAKKDLAVRRRAGPGLWCSACGAGVSAWAVRS
jgi:Zn-dependent oligopeptidase